MAVPLVSGSHPGPVRAAPIEPRSSAARALMGLYGLLMGGWCSVMAMMTASPGDVRWRTFTLFVLIAIVAYLTLRQNNKLRDGSTGMVTGGLVGLIAGGAAASMVMLIGPSSIVPATFAVLAFAAASWLISSFRHASALIDQTWAEFAGSDRPVSSTVTNLVDARLDRQPPTGGPPESERSAS